jgi:hypothetical protein
MLLMDKVLDRLGLDMRFLSENSKDKNGTAEEATTNLHTAKQDNESKVAGEG